MADDVTKQPLDAETLAAFLDGTLSAEERTRVLRALAESPDAYADFIEASAIHRELASSQPTPAVAARPTRPRDGSRWRSVRVLVPLAMAAGVAIVFVARRPATGSSGMIALAQSAAESNGVRPLGPGWDQPVWSVVRGGEDAATAHGRAFRSGVYVTELEYAARLGDTAAVRRAANALARAAGAYDGGGPVAERFRSLSEPNAVADAQARSTTAAQLRTLGQPENWFDLGVWTEIARLSVRANDLSVFNKGSDVQRQIARIAISLAGQPAGESPQILAALQPIVVGRQWTATDRDSLSAIVDRVMNLAAR